jgi:hypothetical protein
MIDPRWNRPLIILSRQLTDSGDELFNTLTLLDEIANALNDLTSRIDQLERYVLNQASRVYQLTYHIEK